MLRQEGPIQYLSVLERVPIVHHVPVGRGRGGYSLDSHPTQVFSSIEELLERMQRPGLGPLLAQGALA